ncbi:hypothetical protein [Moorena producens]|uniref:hypothetical protein n=1 Tax=Moorena producens TaxID=1155739 RepID=UPI0011EA704F|nr:hypothetical protein [Moorena producens]
MVSPMTALHQETKINVQVISAKLVDVQVKQLIEFNDGYEYPTNQEFNQQKQRVNRPVGVRKR